MKLLIFGSRGVPPDLEIFSQLTQTADYYQDTIGKITEIVSGGASGGDAMGEVFAKGYGIPVKKFLPDWNKYGKSAGFIRNEEMVKYCDTGIGLWDGKSSGTKHTIKLLHDSGKKYGVIYYANIIANRINK